MVRLISCPQLPTSCTRVDLVVLTPDAGLCVEALVQTRMSLE